MTRDDVLDEFSEGNVTRYYNVIAMADEIVRLREERESVSSQLYDCMNERDGLRSRLAAMEAERDALKKSRDAAWQHVAQASEATGIDGEYLLLEQVALLRAQYDRFERILAKLREPSEAMVKAVDTRLVHALTRGDVFREVIIRAVAAAEQEASDEAR